MKRLLLGCFVSSLMGALIAFALTSDQSSENSYAYAQSGVATPRQRSPLPESAYRQSPAARQQTLPTELGQIQGAYTPEELANIRVYATANPGVVNITTSTVQFDMFGLPVGGGQGSGSGSVIDKQGHILTNNHVIEDAQQIEVTLASGKTYPAELIGADAEYDMAVVRIDAPADELYPIRLGRSDNLRVGQKAYAVGNPFGLEGSLTIGIVSSLNRSVPSRAAGRAMTGMIQTDAAMNPGNSGGPLLNGQAEMIGMNVAIASRIGQNSGVGFAIPVDRLRKFLPELIENGKVLRAYHGIVQVTETPDGLRIRKLSNGGPAEQAGLRGVRMIRRQQRRGNLLYVETKLDHEHADTIISIDGKPVATHTDFLDIMDQHKPGDEVTFTILRDGRRQQTTLTLGAA